ncbi:MAG: DUF6770 family protein [Saprospiraceae bacterium]|nr:hypothetical protein [Lewinella sp.]
MRNLFLIGTLWGICLLSCYPMEVCRAQSRSFGELAEVRIISLKALKIGERVDGYYISWEKEAEDSNGKELTIQLFDHNLDPIGQQVFKGTQNLLLQAVAYNGKNLAVRLWDRKKGIWCSIINSKGETIRTVELDERIPETLSPIKWIFGGLNLQPVDNGFLISLVHSKLTPGKTDFEYLYIPDDPAQKVLNYKFERGRTYYQVAALLANEQELFLSRGCTTFKPRTKKTQLYLQGLNIKTGREVFRLTEADTRYKIWAKKAIIQNDSIFVAGAYYEQDEQYLTDDPKGVFLLKLNRAGILLEEYYYSFDVQSLSDFSSADKTSGEAESYHILVHDICFTPSGGLVMAGETYQKSGYGLEISSGLLAAFNSQLNLTSAEFIEKPVITDLSSLRLFGRSRAAMALSSNYRGIFNFRYLQQENGTCTAAFLSHWQQTSTGYPVKFQKKEERDPTPHVYAYSLKNGVFIANQFSLNPNCTHSEIYPARGGYIMVKEYFEKEKDLNTRLIRLITE